MSRSHKFIAMAWTALFAFGSMGIAPAQKAPGIADKIPPATVPNVTHPAPAPAIPVDVMKEPSARSFDLNAFTSKRDPFKSLVKPTVINVDMSPDKVKRPSGIRGMLVSEIKLIGLAKGLTGDPIAIVMGNDQKAHFMKSGDRVWDGTIKSVDDTSVLFIKETKRGSGAIQKQDVKMYLYPPIQQ